MQSPQTLPTSHSAPRPRAPAAHPAAPRRRCAPGCMPHRPGSRARRRLRPPLHLRRNHLGRGRTRTHLLQRPPCGNQTPSDAATIPRTSSSVTAPVLQHWRRHAAVCLARTSLTGAARLCRAGPRAARRPSGLPARGAACRCTAGSAPAHIKHVRVKSLASVPCAWARAGAHHGAGACTHSVPCVRQRSSDHLLPPPLDVCGETHPGTPKNDACCRGVKKRTPTCGVIPLSGRAPCLRTAAASSCAACRTHPQGPAWPPDKAQAWWGCSSQQVHVGAGNEQSAEDVHHAPWSHCAPFALTRGIRRAEPAASICDINVLKRRI